jgi:hypothetical protein
MPTILTDRDTPRLRYVADLLFRRWAGMACTVTADPAIWHASGPPRILYTRLPTEGATDAYHIQPSGLLSEEGVSSKPVPEGFVGGRPLLFPSDSGDHPFDVFSAAFHLVTRYEEYLPHPKDPFGRFDHRRSIAHRLGFLQRPIVEEWASALLAAVFAKAGLPLPPIKPFSFETSCDIDIAYAHRHKGFARSAAAALRSLSKLRPDLLSQQFRALTGLGPDPHDSYEWLEEIHRRHSFPCRYFILLSSRYRGLDRNLNPGSPAMGGLVRRLSASNSVGLHPSWGSGDRPARLAEEKERLESLAGGSVSHSRQHYLRFSLPTTYRRLLEHGVTDDHSMGYGTVNGYRASFSHPFPWYDLEADRCTGLTVHPFCFMDATAHHEEGLGPEEGLGELRRYLDCAKSTGGVLSTVWHNSMLGTDPLYAGWREVYGVFLSEVRQTLEEAGSAFRIPTS